MTTSDVLHLLRDGTLEIQGRLLDASNATLYCAVTAAPAATNEQPGGGPGKPDEPQHCVYKPVSGERPLWDFPDGTLADREVAAYLVSEATGWGLVPPTVLRDGPFGRGMVQLWIDVDETVDLVELARSDSPQLRRMAVFDAVVNNADRKGGHLLPTPDGHIYGVDHGVCFSYEDKLRTLLWRWRGEPLTAEALDVLGNVRDALAGDLGDRLRELLTPGEVRHTLRRVERLLAERVHPQPSPDWPAIPWPPF